MKKQFRASFTVEAALLVPTVLLVLLLVLFLIGHVHNRAILTCCAALEAVTGKEQETDLLILAASSSHSKTETDRKRTVSCQIDTSPPLGGMRFVETIEISYGLQDPVHTLRIARVVKNLLEAS